MENTMETEVNEMPVSQEAGNVAEETSQTSTATFEVEPSDDEIIDEEATEEGVAEEEVIDEEGTDDLDENDELAMEEETDIVDESSDDE